MRIGIIGYGKMGKAIEQIAIQRGHEVTCIIDKTESDQNAIPQLKSNVDVAIEFSTPKSAEKNILSCIESGIPVVSGTTGWIFDHSRLNEKCIINKTAFFFASNFSIGVNIFMAINQKLATLLSDFETYKVQIEETHHIHKIDKPSGTAITLAEDIIKNNENYKNWELKPSNNILNIEIDSLREGETIGEHKIKWENEIDTITIGHNAKTRKGFALGAVLAAEFIKNKSGYFTMNDLIKL